MPEAIPEDPPMPDRPWRDGLVAGVGATLFAGLIVALADASTAGFGAFPVVLGLWAPLALGLGIVNGLVIAGFRATFGERGLAVAMKKLRGDRDRDIAITGAVLAAVVVALIAIVFIGSAANSLVANVERKATGARLLGVVVVAVLPLLALLAFPIFRVTRKIALVVPPAGPLPRVVFLVVVGVLAIAALGLFVVFTQLDWQVLGLGFYGLVFSMFALAVLLVMFGGGLGQRIPARGFVALGAAVLAALLPVLTLRGAPSRDTKTAVLDDSLGGARLVKLYGGFFDGDKDGYTTFFGGPDCDDGDKDVHPGGNEVPDDGKDNDCRDGDLSDADLEAYKKELKERDKQPEPKVGEEPVKPLAEGANVLVVMVDTVRADKVGAERDGIQLTPRISALAQQGVQFTRGYSVASNTPRAMPAFMTGRYPSMVAVDKLNSNYPNLDESNTMLFEVLKSAGLATYGFSSHYYFQEKRHFAQGFDDYNNEGWLDVGPANKDNASTRIVPRVVAKLDELGKSGQRFAMWVHLFEPHSSYMEHEGMKITTRGTESLKQKYDFEIAFVDGYIGQIFDALDAAKLSDKTLVVVLSDHGEAFGVHRFAGQKMFFHGQTLYDELLRIPVVMRGPGIAAGAKNDQVVQLIDVAPTILDALGIAVPETVQGRSLVPALRGQELAPRAAFAELIPYPNWKHEARAMVSPDGKWKLFDRVSDNKVELYDLTADPEETKDVYDQNKETADAMASEMAKFFAVMRSE